MSVSSSGPTTRCCPTTNICPSATTAGRARCASRASPLSAPTASARPRTPRPPNTAQPAASITSWNSAQIVAHHSSNGCNLQPGDLIGTGTLSTDSAGGLGSLLEISQGGKQPVELANGETRSFLEDGDEVTLKAWCDGAVRIGFGE